MAIKKINIVIIVLIFLSATGGFVQNPPRKVSRFENPPVILEIDKLTNCPIEIVSLNLGKIQVKTYRDGGSNTQRKLAESFEINPSVIKAHYSEVMSVIDWFHRLKNTNKQLERKTVSIVFKNPETQRLTKVNLWYAWPSMINLKQEEGITFAYITFQTDNVKILYPQK